MAGITFVLREPTAKTPQSINCIVRIGNADRVKFSTGLSVLPKNWDKEKGRVKNVVAEKNKAMINSKLNDIEEEFDKLTTRHLGTNTALSKEFVKLHFEEYLKPKQAPTLPPPQLTPTDIFFSVIDSYIADSQSGKRKNGNDGNIKKETIGIYKTVKARLEEFFKDYDRKASLQIIDNDFYNDFVEWLKTTKFYSKNTIGKYIKDIKSIMNYAVEEGFIDKVSYKVNKFKTVSEDSESVYLTIAELERIYALDLSQNLRLERVRDLFIVGAYTGFRFSDLNNIRSSDIRTDEDGDQFIEIVQKKTEDPVIVPILPLVKEIFVKYNHNLPSLTNQKMNDYIKEVCQMAGINEIVTKRIERGGIKVETQSEKWEVISSHTARRSFATNAYKKGIDTISIMAITGHRKEESFRRYLKVDNKEKAKRFKNAWLSSTIEESKDIIKLSLTA